MKEEINKDIEIPQNYQLKWIAQIKSSMRSLANGVEEVENRVL
jgi:hypothetical protein